jgi:hypothetical protein
MMPIRTSLQSRLPQSATGEDELHVLRRRAWQEQGIAMLPVTDITDEWVRRAIENEATRRYGRRKDET